MRPIVCFELVFVKRVRSKSRFIFCSTVLPCPIVRVSWLCVCGCVSGPWKSGSIGLPTCPSALCCLLSLFFFFLTSDCLLSKINIKLSVYLYSNPFLYRFTMNSLQYDHSWKAQLRWINFYWTLLYSLLLLYFKINMWKEISENEILGKTCI